MSKSTRRWAALGAAGALWIGGALAGDLKVTYLGNSGFYIDSGEHQVVVDGLYYKGSPGFSRIPEDELRELIKAREPYDRIGVVLTSHRHPDHFQWLAHDMHLSSNPAAELVTVPEVAYEIAGKEHSKYEDYSDRVHIVLPEEGKSETLEFYGVRVTVFNFTHGNTDPPVQQIGFLIEIGGQKLLHVGDSQASQQELAALGLDEMGIDVVFLPYWDVHRRYRRELYASTVRPRKMVVMHVPTEDAPESFFAPAKSRTQLLQEIRAAAPDAILFDEHLETRVLPGR